MNQITKGKANREGSTEAVKFTDGMLVTAEDLNAVTRYPLAVTQLLLRAYFGCGIVCGLTVASRQGTPAGSLIVDIARGVALGCDGYPIELCDALGLDFSPDPCGCPAAPGTKVAKYIAIRRLAATAPAPRQCGCGPAAGEPGQQCSRLQDHVVVQAFDEKDLPAGICMRPRAPREGEPKPHVHSGACECMTHCPDCDPCAEPWVLLATVVVNAETVAIERIINAGDEVGIYGGPRWVKPIACLCGGEAGTTKALAEIDKKLKTLDARLRKVEPKPAAAPAAPVAPPAAAAPAGPGAGPA